MRKIPHTLVLGCLMLASSGAMAAITTMTFTGTFGAGASDQGVGQSNGVLGAPSSLAGKPFTLVLTIDDTGSYTQPLYPDSVSNVANAKGVLTVNGVSVNLGTFLSTSFSTNAACGYYVLFASQNDAMNTDEVAVDLDSFYAPPHTTPWNALCDVSIPITQNIWSYVSLQRSSPSSLGMAQLSGEMLISHVTVNSGTATQPPTAAAMTPQVGLWWNPAESGTGYALDVKHGVLVVTVYSYTQAGAPFWYLVDGPIVNNSFNAPMTKYLNGQCISCNYQAPTMNGDDGTMTINFTSSTTATMTLPGRGTFNIVPQAF